MAATDMEKLLEFLAAHGPDLAQPMDQIRATYNAMLAAQPLVQGYLQTQAEIGGVPCSLCTPTALTADAPVMLYLHGGGYMLGAASAYVGVASGFASRLGATVYVVDYPLAPEHPAPAQHDAAVAVYCALLEDGIDASRIVVAGDSAGGNLSLALALTLRDRGLALPAALELISPWTDMTQSGGSYQSRAAEDFLLSHEGLSHMAGATLADGNVDARDQRVSPLFADLKGLPPMHIQVGTNEVLLDDSLRLATAAAHADVVTQLRVWPGMPHDWTLFAQILATGQQAMDEAGEFLRRYL